MSSVKTAISLPVELLNEVDRRAAEAGDSRSGLIRAALDRYLDELKEREFRDTIREVYSEAPDPEDEEFRRKLRESNARIVLRETEW
jgi:metal-responsive CopG/Arc/MetJ family transcriptional regulator